MEEEEADNNTREEEKKKKMKKKKNSTIKKKNQKQNSCSHNKKKNNYKKKSDCAESNRRIKLTFAVQCSLTAHKLFLAEKKPSKPFFSASASTKPRPQLHLICITDRRFNLQGAGDAKYDLGILGAPT